MTAPSSNLLEALIAEVSTERLVSRTLAMVEIPSCPGEEGAMADAYGALLEEAGARVEIDREFPESPSVIGRYGGGTGLLLQLDGHLDTVSTPHAPPSIVDGRIYGRGSCDMKSGLAVICEVVEIISSCGLDLDGGLLLTAHGQHEEPAAGRELHAPLLGLLRRGIKGDACLIPEGPHLEVPLAGRGLVIFRASFTRDGEPVHEILSGPTPPPNPLDACHRFISLLETAREGWVAIHPLAGRESFFVGAVNGGDYYNRIPNVASVRGTRRYPTGQDFAHAADELTALAERAADEVGVEVDLKLEKSGQPFAIDEDEPIVRALQSGARQVLGKELPVAGMQYSGDVSQFINEGRIPALYHGTDSTTAHGDVEYVGIDDLTRCAKVVLAATVQYLTQTD